MEFVTCSFEKSGKYKFFPMQQKCIGKEKETKGQNLQTGNHIPAAFRVAG